METLVAVAIVALALAPLLDLQAQLTRQAHQQRARAFEATATQNALALLSGVNPMEQREGRFRSGAIQITWRANPLSEPLRSTRAGAGDGNFMVQLFATDVVAHDRDGREVARFTFDQVGWRQTEPGRE